MAQTGKNIILLMGESGSGKTTLSRLLQIQHGWHDISSYTTRPPRHAGELGHIFITDEEFDQINPEDMCAFTTFNGYRYCATCAQADNADIYVIDPAGVIAFKDRYKNRRNPITIYLKTSMKCRYDRMLSRGDSHDAVMSRLKHDETAFKTAQDIADYTLDGEDDPQVLADKIFKIAGNV